MEETVHIIPLGFEVDRVVKTLEKYKPNRVYLLYLKPSDKKSELDPDIFKGNVLSKLKEMNLSDDDIILENTDLFDILKTLAKVSSIIIKEKSQKNRIYVNMSAASKPAAVAATLAAMYHDVNVYYVKASSYVLQDKAKLYEHGLSMVKEPSMITLANFKIDIPKEPKLAFLVELYKKELSGNGTMDTIDILKLIRAEKLKGYNDLNKYIEQDKNGKIIVRNKKSNVLMRINKGLVSSLEESGYITIEKMGTKNYFSITDKGRYAACLSGKIQN